MFQLKTNLLDIVQNTFHKSTLDQIRIRPIGYACNHACPMCWREHLTPKMRQTLALASKTDLTADEYITMIKSLPASVKRIVFSGGGEPLLFKNIAPVIRVIKDTHRKGHIITNGTLLSGSIADTFIDTEWDNIGISFNATTQKTYKIINGIDTYDTVIKNIKDMLHKRGKRQFPKMQLTFVIQKHNYQEIVSFVQFCITMHIDSINFSALSPHDLTLINKVSDLALNKTERFKALNLLRQAKKVAEKHPSLVTNIDTIIETYETHPSFNVAKSKKSYWGIKYCDVVQNNMDLASDGDVKPCCYGWQIDSGFDFNVRKHNIMDIWNSKQYKQFRDNLREGNFPSLCSKYCTFLLPNI